MTLFAPNRNDALNRLSISIPKAAIGYAKKNYDLGAGLHDHVTCISPHIRRHKITEKEVLQKAPSHHSVTMADKSIKELFWRTYRKGWMEIHQCVWSFYQGDLAQISNQLATQSELRQASESACLERIGTECFDVWARELNATGHLLDGDPASNTLSWCWFGGLQKSGRSHIARSADIAKYTGERFECTNLITKTAPLEEKIIHKPRTIPLVVDSDQGSSSLILIYKGDVDLKKLVDLFPNQVGVFRISRMHRLTPFDLSQKLIEFVNAVMFDAETRWSKRHGTVEIIESVADLICASLDLRAQQIVTPCAAAGPVKSFLNKLSRKSASLGIKTEHVVSEYDQICWLKATHGLSRFKWHVLNFLSRLGIQCKIT